MARTKHTARKATGTKQPRKGVASKSAKGLKWKNGGEQRKGNTFFAFMPRRNSGILTVY